MSRSELAPVPRSDRQDWRVRIHNQVGEDPARYLDKPLTDRRGRVRIPDIVESRVRGIDRLDVAAAWITAERRIERGPRDLILKALEERLEHLEDVGERPRDLSASLESEDVDVPARYYPRPEPESDEETEPATRYDLDGDPYQLRTGTWGTEREYLDRDDGGNS